MKARLASVGAPLLAAALLAGCSQSSPPHASPTRAAPAQAGLPRDTPTATTVRGCESSGQHGVGPTSYAGSLIVGPISLGGLGSELAHTLLAQPRSSGGRYPALESIAILKAGTKVVLAIPRAERGAVALIYDKGKFREDGLYRVRDLDQVVRFEACRDPAFNHGISQFDGGIVVVGRRCFSLDLYVAGMPRRLTRRLPIGARC
jgi:hypothetical protein